ncbi:MAG: sporulation protein Cse60 [Ruminococcus sp.]|nr:sporulation protein Cse60 [Ruminococcus sp.]
MQIKIFSTSFMPEQEKYEKFATFENELNQFIKSVKVIDIKYSTSVGMCHDAQTHVNEVVEDFSALVMYEEN